MKSRLAPFTSRSALAVNVVIIGIFLFYWALNGWAPQTYHWSIQEDEYVEWATFWAFIVAAVIFVRAGVSQRRAGRRVPWFLFGLALFCVLVAMEEISWGQRLFGYQPPAYFLEANFQQEFNLHNIASKSLRKLTVNVIILGYGVALPLATRVPKLRALLDKLAIVGPHAALIPAFIVMSIVYITYPFGSVGEVVEVMMGFGFAFAALAAKRSLAGAPEGKVATEAPPAASVSMMGPITVSLFVVFGLGLLAAAGSRWLADDDPAKISTAQREIDAMAQDVAHLYKSKRGALRRKRGIHKRVYSYVQKYGKEGADYLDTGAYRQLVARGLSEDRAQYYLDPWNAPYWIRKETDRASGYVMITVYSFGPNRRRESTDWELLGDDIGKIVVESGVRPPGLGGGAD